MDLATVDKLLSGRLDFMALKNEMTSKFILLLAEKTKTEGNATDFHQLVKINFKLGLYSKAYVTDYQTVLRICD